MRILLLVPCKRATQLGHTINGKFPQLFGISVDGYQLLARLARWDELYWI
jgi:hypothetical protein